MLQLDLSKLPDGQNVEDNVLNLLSITQVFFEALINSVDECPWFFLLSIVTDKKGLLENCVST